MDAESQLKRQGAAFQSTHWSLVLEASDMDQERAAQALNELCQRYWYPLYAFARRAGRSPHDAQDSTQGFFAKLLDKGYIQSADRNKGKFRTFMITAFKGYLANEWKHQQAIKRGGQAEHFSLNSTEAEDRYQLEPTTEASPEQLYDKRWAISLIDRVYSRLESEYARLGKSDRFQVLSPFLLEDPSPDAYDSAVVKLDLTKSGARTAVMRLRKQFSDMLRGEIADTVDHAGSIEGEIEYLLQALSNG